MQQGIPGAGGAPPLFRQLAIPASGLSAERRRIETIAANIANAETTRTPEGGPYQRQLLVVRAERAPFEPMGEWQLSPDAMAYQPPAEGVAVVGAVADPTQGPLIYDPGHPDADEAGYVRYPNVSIAQETADLMSARRAYEANATVFDAMKAILRRALEI